MSNYSVKQNDVWNETGTVAKTVPLEELSYRELTEIIKEASKIIVDKGFQSYSDISYMIETM